MIFITKLEVIMRLLFIMIIMCFSVSSFACKNEPHNNEAKSADAPKCDRYYQPVCGTIDVQCVKAPCPPVQQTFINDCIAKEHNARDIKIGSCEKQSGITPIK